MSEIRLNTTGGSGGSVSLKGPASTTGNADVDFVLPQADGSAGQYLKTDGSKNLSFATVSSVGDGTGVDFNDSVKTRWGTDNDLEMYHDNSNSYIKHANNGSLEIDATNSGHIILKPDGEVKVSNSKNLKIDDGNLVIGTSGHGIDFSAASGSAGGSASSVLDDYEEGTWTPAFGGSSGDPTLSGYHSQTGGWYVKVGRLVTAWFFIYGQTVNSDGSGTLLMKGLPFSASAANDGGEGVATAGWMKVGTTLAADDKWGYWRNTGGTDYLKAQSRELSDGAQNNPSQAGSLINNALSVGAIYYRTASV